MNKKAAITLLVTMLASSYSFAGSHQPSFDLSIKETKAEKLKGLYTKQESYNLSNQTRMSKMFWKITYTITNRGPKSSAPAEVVFTRGGERETKRIPLMRPKQKTTATFTFRESATVGPDVAIMMAGPYQAEIIVQDRDSSNNIARGNR